jgi:putative transposase
MPRRRRHCELTATIAHLRAELRLCRREFKRVSVENEVLREAAAPLIHQAPARERFAFIHLHRARFGLRRLCRILITDCANDQARVRAMPGRQEQEREERQLMQLVVEVHTAHPAYGVERVTRELKRLGFAVGRRRVARRMRDRGISGVTRRKRRNLTRPDSRAAQVPDLIRRDFTAPMPGLKLIGDISCFPTGEGWVYLATVLDLCSKELVGYAVTAHMRASLAVDAIASAHRSGLVAENAIMHTDRGSQYHSKLYRSALGRLEIRQSTSRTGSCLDGAASESFFATIKTEIGITAWSTRAAARRDIENWITDYNCRRLHSSLGYQTPTSMRRAWQDRMAIAL